MNTSPFEIFRRNLKPLMILLTGLALFAFVVLPVVDSYMRQNAGAGGSSVVATYDGNQLTRNRVDYFTRNHNETVGFLVKLANATIQRGGVPRTAGFQYDPRSQRIVRLGINENPGTDVSVRTMMFAAEAKKAGFDLDDNAIRIWLDRFTDGTVSDTDITGLLMTSTQNRMGRPHLYEQLRSHLLADVYLKRGYTGLYSGDNPSQGALMTPSEQWESFVKLNRSATVDAYGVLVNDYIDQTNETPPENLILATYEDGKNRDPSDQSAEPAFHERYTASFEYLVGDLTAFIDDEVAKLKEADIRAEYDKRVAGGGFQLPDDDLSEVLETDEAADASPTDADTTEGQKPDEAAEDTPAGEPNDEQDDASKDETESTDSETPDAEAKDDQPAPAPEADNPASEGSESDQQSLNQASRSVRLVALQDDDEESASEAGDSEETPAPESSDEAETSEPAEEKDSTEEATDEESKESSGDEADATDKEALDKDGEDKAADDDMEEGSEEEEAKPKVQTFEEVREQIANDLAFPAAQQRMVESAAKIFKQMESYFTQKAIYDSNVAVGQEGEEPKQPDLEALAKELGFEFKAIGPYSVATISDEPISTSMDAQTQFGSRGPNFALMMFGYSTGQNVVEPRELFTPLQTTEFMSGKTYVSWKVDQTDASTPTLAEARDDVIRYLRMREAKDFAQAAAEELAEQAAQQSDKPLADLIPADKKDNLQAGLGPFKWMDSIGRGVTMGNVPELDAVGDDFMVAVFEGDVGEYRIAPNQPERVIYVVKPTKFEPSIDELHQQFREPMNRRNITAIDSGIRGVLGEFYESMVDKARFVDHLTVSEL